MALSGVEYVPTFKFARKPPTKTFERQRDEKQQTNKYFLCAKKGIVFVM